MRFTELEIDLARRMRSRGLSWEPAVGDYVYDEGGLIAAASPFQPGVYCILDLKHFLRRSGDMATLKTRVFWLPQWHQCRTILRRLGVSDAAVLSRLVAGWPLETPSELCLLYEWILETSSARARAVGS